MSKVNGVNPKTWRRSRGYYVISQIVGSKEFNEQSPVLDTNTPKYHVGCMIAKIYEDNPIRWEREDYRNEEALKSATVITYATNTLCDTDCLNRLRQIQKQYYQSNQVSDNEMSDNKSSEQQSAKSKIDTKKYFSLEQYAEMNRLRKEYGDPELGLLSCKSVEEALHKIDYILKVNKRTANAYRIVCENVANDHSPNGKRVLEYLEELHQAYEQKLAEKTDWHTKAMAEVQYYYDNFADCPDLLPFKEAVEKAHSVGKLCKLTNEVDLYNFCINNNITIEDVNKYLQVNSDGKPVFICSLEEFITIKNFVR